MVIVGYARRVRASLQPAQVIDPAIAAGGDPAEIAAHCLIAVDPGFAERVREGDVLVLDGSFAGGAGAEAALIALQAAGLAALICRTADADLLALGARYGLPLLVAPEAAAQLGEGAVVRLDLERGHIASGDLRWTMPAADPTTIAAARRVHLLARMRRVVEDEGLAEG